MVHGLFMGGISIVTMFTVEVTTHAEDLDAIRDDWAELVARTPGADFFLTYEWHRTWLKSFWRSRRIAYHVVRSGGELVGVVPLVPVSPGRQLRHPGARGWLPFGRALVSPFNSHLPRSDSLILPSRAEEIVNAFVEAVCRSGVREVVFHRQDLESNVGRLLAGQTRQSGFESISVHEATSQIAEAPRGWGDYVTSRSHHLVREYRRKRRKLENAGCLDMEIGTTEADLRRLGELVASIEEHSWKRVRHSAMTDSHQSDFYAEVFGRSAEAGWLRIYLLRLDGRPIAHICGVEHRGVFYALKTSYDEGFKSLAPGAVLFWMALEDAFDGGIERVEFLGGSSRWKLELATGCRRSADVVLMGPSRLDWRLYKWLHATAHRHVGRRRDVEVHSGS